MDSEDNKERKMSDSKDRSENGSDSQSKSPNIEVSENGSDSQSKSPNIEVSESPLSKIEASQSPLPNIEASQSPLPNIEASQSSLSNIEASQSPLPNIAASQSPLSNIEASQSPLPNIEASQSPLPNIEASQSPLPNIAASQSPLSNIEASQSPLPNIEASQSPLPNIEASQSPLSNIEAKSSSPLPPSPVLSSAVDLDASADKELSGVEASSPEHQEPRDSSHTSSPSSTKTIPSSQANTEKYQGDQSSYDSETIDDKSTKKKVLKKKKEPQLDSSSDPECVEVSTLAPLRHVSVEEIACQTDKTCRADMQRVSLPGLVALQGHIQLPVADRAGPLFEGEKQLVLEDGGSGRSAVLSTGFSAKLRGDTPAVLVPLDKLCVQHSTAQEGPAGTTAPPRRGGPVMDLHATYRSSKRSVDTATSGGKRHTVDANVTYRAPGAGERGRGGAQWTVDIDGAGLQVIVDMADENKNRKKKPKKKNVPRKLISFWPKRTKPNLNPAARRRLVWLEDEAEEKHVARLQRARQPPWSRAEVPEHQRTSTVTSTDRSGSRLEAESSSQHLQRMSRARELKERPGRLMPPRPSEVPPPSVLPESSVLGVYEDSRTKRIRDARAFYNDLSVNAAQSFNVEIDSN